ncbi:hypothetical protein [Amycolatopsis sp. NPDC004378]
MPEDEPNAPKRDGQSWITRVSDPQRAAERWRRHARWAIPCAMLSPLGMILLVLAHLLPGTLAVAAGLIVGGGVLCTSLLGFGYIVGERRTVELWLRSAAADVTPDDLEPSSGEVHVAGTPAPSGSKYDLMHGLLVAVLRKLGGSVEMDAADFSVEAMGTTDGRFYAVDIDRRDGRIHVTVINPHA